MSDLENMVTRGVVTGKNGSRKMRTVQVLLLNEDLREDVEHFEPYGFTSEIEAGAEVLAISLGGSREHTIAIVCPDRQYRPAGLKDGEVCIYDKRGRKILLGEKSIEVEGVSDPINVTTEGEVTVTSKSNVTVTTPANIIADAPLVKMTGNLEVAGNIFSAANITAAGGISAGSGATVSGDITASGEVKDQGGSYSMSGMRETYDGHTHDGGATPDKTM